MSLFRKPKKNIVQRRVFTENDDEDEPMDVQPVVRPEKENKTKEKSKKHQKQKLLSFEMEEEGEVFQVKKSSHSKKMLRMFEKEKHRKKEPKVEREENKVKDPKKEIVTDDLILVINSNHKKPPTPPPPVIMSGRDALFVGKDDLSSEEEDNSTHRFSKPDNFKSVLESGAIPDAAMIHAARKKRQRAREMGDFIPTEEEEPEDTGRHMRDEDQEGSDEERIDMDVNMAKRDQERRREQFLAAQESESDHEEDEWEDQQIRKGVTSATAVAMAQELMAYTEYQSNQEVQQQPNVMPAMEPGIPRTPQMIADKLKEHFQNLQDSEENNRMRLGKIQNDIEEVTQELKELEMKAPNAAQRFKFYQELRGYITDLVECLDEKVGVITSLEQRANDLMGKKSEWLIERRRQDVRDQAEEATIKGGIIKKGPDDEEKIRRAAEREGRRTRRRRAREVPNSIKHIEGMSSDDEVSQQDILNFTKEREVIESEIESVFEDVVEEYSSCASILIRFEQWRENDLTAYTEAYATLCLPKVVSPLVRLNLVFWDPLNETSDIEKLDWYRTMALYGLHDDETEYSLSKDPDINLLPTIIDKVIVPKLTILVDKCWDPLSSSQTLRLVGIINRYIRKYPSLGPASKSLNNLFNAIMHKMKTSLEHDVFIPVTPKLAESKSQFFQRQFALGLKLLKNITSWQNILNDNTLKDLAINSLLNRYLLSAVKFCLITDAVQKLKLITLILPRIWFQESTPELKQFGNNAVALLQQLDKTNPVHLESIEILNGLIKLVRSNM